MAAVSDGPEEMIGVGKIERKDAWFSGSRTVQAFTVPPKCNTEDGYCSEESPWLPGDSDEDLEDELELPPTPEYRSRNAPRSPSPERSRALARREMNHQLRALQADIKLCSFCVIATGPRL